VILANYFAQKGETGKAMNKRMIGVLVMPWLLAACGDATEIEKSVDQLESDAASAIERLEALTQPLGDMSRSDGTERAPILPSPGGVYSAGWFTGPCEKIGRPEHIAIGQTFQVVAYGTRFYLWNDGVWDYDSGVSHPYSGTGYEYRCTPDSDRTLLPARFIPRSEMPVRYKMVKTGSIANYEVRKCLNVAGGPCATHVGTDEIHEEFEFEVTR
jgi:hypothetical protein